MRINFTYAGRKFKDDNEDKIWVVSHMYIEDIDYATVYLKNNQDDEIIQYTWYYYTESLNEMLHNWDLEPID